MTLYEFRCLMVDDSQQIVVYDISGDDCEPIYRGEFRELPDEYEDVEISSIDPVYKDMGFISINVELEEEEW